MLFALHGELLLSNSKTVNTWKISGMLIVYWPITIKFRIRMQSSKPQPNYRCCLLFSYLLLAYFLQHNNIPWIFLVFMVLWVSHSNIIILYWRWNNNNMILIWGGLITHYYYLLRRTYYFVAPLPSNGKNWNTRNISGMLLCCNKKANQAWEN